MKLSSLYQTIEVCAKNTRDRKYKKKVNGKDMERIIFLTFTWFGGKLLSGKYKKIKFYCLKCIKEESMYFCLS